MDATSLATLWATVALVIFLGVAVYIKVPGLIAKALDARAARISNELDEARRLREEAQQLLGQYQRKRKEAEQEAADIVAAAKREADMLAADAHKKTEDYVVRRTALAEQKIGQAERDAVAKSAPAPSTSPSRQRARCSPARSTPRRVLISSRHRWQDVKSKLN